MFQHTAFVK